MTQSLYTNHRLNLGPAYGISGEVSATGDGATSTFNFSITNTPVSPGTFSATDGTETFSDNGDGTLTGDQGGDGTIDYWSGDVTLNFAGNVTDTQDITIDYDRILPATEDVVDEDQGDPYDLADEHEYDNTWRFGGTLDNTEIIPNTFSAQVDFSSSPVTITDDGDGNLSGTNVQSGSVNYNTGDFFIIFESRPDDGSSFLVDYSHGLESDTEKIIGEDVSGVFSVEIHNQADGDVGLSFVKSSDLQNWSLVDSISIGQGNKKFLTVAGPMDYLKVVGSGGRVDLQFHQ